MKRITVDQVKKAYETTGLQPKKGKFFSVTMKGMEKVKCACGMGAVYMHEAQNSIMSEYPVIKYLDDNYGTDYRAGFAHGFDDEPCELEDTDERFQQGYEDGKAAREAIFEEK